MPGAVVEQRQQGMVTCTIAALLNNRRGGRPQDGRSDLRFAKKIRIINMLPTARQAVFGAHLKHHKLKEESSWIMQS
jgi:hypothetical protein